MEQTLAEVEAHPIATHRVVRVALLRHGADLALRRTARPQALEEALAKLTGSASRDIRHALQIELATLGGDLAALDRVADEAGAAGPRDVQDGCTRACRLRGARPRTRRGGGWSVRARPGR